MAVFHVQDPSDARLEPYRLVQDRDRGGAESRPGLFVGETAIVLEAMLARPGCTRSILASEAQAERAIALVERARSAWPRGTSEPQLLVVPNALVEGIVGFNVHRGLLAIGERPAPRALETLIPAAPEPATLLCVEGVNNMDNIGQLFRVAAAFACCGVVLSPECHDPLYRKSLRVSCGHVLRVPFVRSAAWSVDLERLRGEHGFALIGATGQGDPLGTRSVGAARGALDALTGPGAPRREGEPHAHSGAAPSGATAPRVALLVGAEFAGLAPETLAACDRRVRIPMAPGVDSLNVAVAAAVLLDRFSLGRRV